MKGLGLKKTENDDWHALIDELKEISTDTTTWLEGPRRQSFNIQELGEEVRKKSSKEKCWWELLRNLLFDWDIGQLKN